MSNQKTSLEIDCGATWNIMITYKDARGNPVDVLGMSARMHFKRLYADVSPAFELTTQNSRLTMMSGGRIKAEISSTDTATLDGKYIWDIELVDGSNVIRLAEGTITCNPKVTGS